MKKNNGGLRRKIIRQKSPWKTGPAAVMVDSVVRHPWPRQRAPIVAAASRHPDRWWQAASRARVTLAAAVAGLFLAFAGGAAFVLSAGSSDAAGQPQVLAGFTIKPGTSIIVSDSPQGPAAATVTGQALFDTPLRDLKQYVADIVKPDVLAVRTAQIRQYLDGKNSPLAAAAATIAAQPHWNIILAVAFAESSLGKNCTDYNCSNIGIKPGAPQWRRYSGYDNWVVDFNRLLDTKYKDWTLQEMCGVYVKPCNSNWLLATQQVLNELHQEHSE